MNAIDGMNGMMDMGMMGGPEWMHGMDGHAWWT
jgi:hypothetical protein